MTKYVAYHLLKKFSFKDRKTDIKTWSRDSTITSPMIGHVIHVHNGKKHIPIYITKFLIGHKLGEFSFTRTFKSHKPSDKKIKTKKKNDKKA